MKSQEAGRTRRPSPPRSQQLFNLFFTSFLSTFFFSLYPFFFFEGSLIVELHLRYLTNSAVRRQQGGVFLKRKAVRSKSRMKAHGEYKSLAIVTVWSQRSSTQWHQVSNRDSECRYSVSFAHVMPPSVSDDTCRDNQFGFCEAEVTSQRFSRRL